MTTQLGDLFNLLTGIPDPAGGPDPVPVIWPGGPMSSLPAIVLAPDDDDLEAGRVLRTSIEVTVIVARAEQIPSYLLLERLYRSVLDRLIGTGFAMVPPFRFAVGGPPDDPPYMARVVPVSFNSHTLCPPPRATRSPAPDPTPAPAPPPDPEPEPDPDPEDP
jgi:hypothetical protein